MRITWLKSDDDDGNDKDDDNDRDDDNDDNADDGDDDDGDSADRDDDGARNDDDDHDDGVMMRVLQSTSSQKAQDVDRPLLQQGSLDNSFQSADSRNLLWRIHKHELKT